MLPWSVIPRAGWPSAAAAATTSSTRDAPSSIEYSVCTWQWQKLPSTGPPQRSVHTLWTNYTAGIRQYMTAAGPGSASVGPAVMRRQRAPEHANLGACHALRRFGLGGGAGV